MTYDEKMHKAIARLRNAPSAAIGFVEEIQNNYYFTSRVKYNGDIHIAWNQLRKDPTEETANEFLLMLDAHSPKGCLCTNCIGTQFYMDGGYNPTTKEEMKTQRGTCNECNKERMVRYHVGEIWICSECLGEEKGTCEGCESILFECDEEMGEIYLTHDNNTVCIKCYEDHYFTCEHCDEVYPNDDMRTINDYAYVCEECYDDLSIGECVDCGEQIFEGGDYDTRYDDEYLCYSCKDDYNLCESCSERFEPHEDGAGEDYCPTCNDE